MASSISLRTAALRNALRRPLLALTSALLACVAFSSEAAAASSNQEILTAILVASATTEEAVRRADASIQTAYRERREAEHRLAAALRIAGLSQEARRRAKAEHKAARLELNSLLTRMAVRDEEYAASLRAYREGLTGLLGNGDPHITEALSRYADGEVAALDDLQEFVRLVRKAREAGVNARNAADQRAVATTFADAKDKGQKTARAVLAAWEEAAELDPASVWTWIEIADLRKELGQLAGAQVAARRAAETATTSLSRLRALRLGGTLAVERGAFDEALGKYQAALDLAEARLKRSATIIANRDVAVALVDLADLAVARGQNAQAKLYYDRAVQQRRAALAINPTSTSAQRGVAMALYSRADFAGTVGGYDDARKALTEGVAITEALAAVDPSSLVAQRDVSLGWARMGTLEMSQGRFTEAKRALDKTLSIRTAALATDPANAFLQRDVALVHFQQGALNERVGDLASAKRTYSKALSSYRTLLRDNPDSVPAMHDVAEALMRIANIEARQGGAGFGALYNEARDLLVKIHNLDKRSRQAQRDINEFLYRFAIYSMALGNLDKSFETLVIIISEERKVLAEDPSSRYSRLALSSYYAATAAALTEQAKLDKAANYAERAALLGQQVLADEPTSVSIMSTVSACHEQLGDIRQKMGSPVSAAQSYRSALASLAPLIGQQGHRSSVLQATIIHLKLSRIPGNEASKAIARSLAGQLKAAGALTPAEVRALQTAGMETS